MDVRWGSTIITLQCRRRIERHLLRKFRRNFRRHHRPHHRLRHRCLRRVMISATNAIGFRLTDSIWKQHINNLSHFNIFLFNTIFLPSTFYLFLLSCKLSALHGYVCDIIVHPTRSPSVTAQDATQIDWLSTAFNFSNRIFIHICNIQA